MPNNRQFSSKLLDVIPEEAVETTRQSFLSGTGFLKYLREHLSKRVEGSVRESDRVNSLDQPNYELRQAYSRGFREGLRTAISLTEER